jgi:hypothetical protein
MELIRGYSDFPINEKCIYCHRLFDNLRSFINHNGECRTRKIQLKNALLIKRHNQAKERMTRLWKEAAQLLDRYHMIRSIRITTSKNTPLSNCSPQFNSEPSHPNQLIQASCLDDHNMAETSYPNPLTRAPLLASYTITEPSQPNQLGQGSYPNPLARAPLLECCTITDPSLPNQLGQASYLDDHNMAEASHPNPLARAPLLTTYTITEPSNSNLLANAQLSDSFFMEPVYMQSTAAFIRSGNTFPSAFAADDIQAEFS